MKSVVAGALLGALSLSAALVADGTANQANAAVATIVCPLQMARRTITTHIPGPWWTTPIVWRVTQTRIQVIGGQRALVCVYGPAGQIQRREPAGYRCRAIARRFVCRSH